jgi:hypothetical protein
MPTRWVKNIFLPASFRFVVKRARATHHSLIRRKPEIYDGSSGVFTKQTSLQQTSGIEEFRYLLKLR